MTTSTAVDTAPREEDRPVLAKAVGTVPSSRQLAWQEREVQALVHFGMNTFTGREWGSGRENPALFNPTNLDCAQWVQAAQSFGARSITMLCKHHDGFCLWPSQYTRHSVKSSPWRNGQADVAREVSAACRQAGLKFGIYLSPADMHEPTFGRNSQRYNDYYCNQLTELLTKYGEICEVFLDGAQPSGAQQAYDFQRYYRLVRELQPKAVISMRGPDVRWVGNELGRARETEWSVVPLTISPDEQTWPDLTAPDLGSRKQLAGARFLCWYPAAADVSLRRTWFWHPGQEAGIKSLQELLTIYEQSVGRNAVLQLNLCPDTSGRIPEADMKRLEEFGAAIRAVFGTNLVASTKARVEPMAAQDDGTYIQRITFPSAQKVHYVALHEDISKGQRVEGFELAVPVEGNPAKVLRGTTIGWKRLVNLNGLAVQELTLRITQTRAQPFVSVSAY